MIVRPTSAVVKYATPNVDSVHAGRELQVGLVLEGSLQRVGAALRIRVQLVSEDAAPFWAEKFDVPFTDIFSIEDAISEQVVRTLALELTVRENRLLAKHFTGKSEAYHAYLKGRYFWAARSGESLCKALEHFLQAISIDANYALAHTGIADCYNALGLWGFMAPASAFPLAKAAATRALEFDEGLAEAHSALAWAVLHYDWDFASAENGFKRALELNPGYGSAHLWYSMFLAFCKRFDEAFAEIGCAQEIDPLSPLVNTDIGILKMLTRRYDEAIEQFRRTLEIGEPYLLAIEYTAYTYGLMGQSDDCLAWYQKVVELFGRSANSLAQLAYGYAMAGQGDAAIRLAEEIVESYGEEGLRPHTRAQIYAMLGDADRAVPWLERSFEERSPGIVWLGVNPSFDRVRDDPRFRDLLRRAGVA